VAVSQNLHEIRRSNESKQVCELDREKKNLGRENQQLRVRKRRRGMMGGLGPQARRRQKKTIGRLCKEKKGGELRPIMTLRTKKGGRATKGQEESGPAGNGAAETKNDQKLEGGHELGA